MFNTTNGHIPQAANSTIEIQASERERKGLDDREQRLFQSLDLNNDQHVFRSEFEHLLAQMGLQANDPRLVQSLASLSNYQRSQSALDQPVEQEVPQDQFCQAIRPNILLIERALQGKLVIPDFGEFCADITDIYEASRKNMDGTPANYIPQLDLPEPQTSQYGIALCTIDGQRFALGDSETFFSIQSTTKPMNYCLALEEHGPEKVHQHVGREPSGLSFNELTLDKNNRPHNPMINAGAIMSCALIKLQEKQEQARQGQLTEFDQRGWAGTRFDYVLERWQAACGGERPRFSNSVYLSERQTADRNFALGYFMREKGAFPPDIDLQDVLDFYFQCCSIELNVKMMSVVAATLANGGICPISGERVFRTETVQHCLSLMSSCGMYDFSGEFAFSVGLPAKSGVSGAVMIVIPNVMGMCTWSPRLDKLGNSVRGIDFCQRLVKTFDFHNYANLTGGSDKRDPRVSHVQQKAQQVNELVWAASKGDLGALQHQAWRGAALDCADYDLRTPLHLAAAEGQASVVAFYIEQAKTAALDLSPRDRWGGTPLDDAYIHGHRGIVEMLEQAGGGRGECPSRTEQITPTASQVHAHVDQTDELIWAASVGDLSYIRRLVARGVPLDSADYDHRTPLHLAASEGHINIVCYLVDQRVELSPKDRWGGTPLADALRHEHTEVAELLRAKGAVEAASENQTTTMKGEYGNLH